MNINTSFDGTIDLTNFYLYLPSLAEFGSLVFTIIFIIAFFVAAAFIFNIVCECKIFEKAGRSSWEALIPVYNVIVKFQFLGIPLWVLLLLLIPVFNAVVVIIINIYLAKKFNKDIVFIIGLTLVPSLFKAILAFSKNANFDNGEVIINSGNYCYNCGTKMIGNYCTKCGVKK